MLTLSVANAIELPAHKVPGRMGGAPAAGSIEERFARAPMRALQAHEQLFREGDLKSHAYLVVEGAFVLYRLLANGRRQVIGFALPGDHVGLGANARHVSSAEASGQARVRSLAISQLHRQAAEDADLAVKLYEAISHELASTQDLLLTVGRLDAAERVATFLVSLADRNLRAGRAGDRIELPMTRCDIGDFLGLTTETVSRTVTKLSNRQIISRDTRGSIRILDRAALAGVAAGEETL